MAKLLDEHGEEAVVGKTVGYWIKDDDVVSTAELEIKNLGNLGFPRDWPNVYTNSKVLKSLVGKRGSVAGKKVGVVAMPTAEEKQQAKGITCHPWQSFMNAEAIEKESGLTVVRGWAILEHLDKPTSSAFVAVRYWWNSFPDGRWVDFTPRPKEWPELLLAEAAHGAPKSKTELTAADLEIMFWLLRQYYRIATPAAPAADASALKEEKLAESKEPAGSLKDLARRVQAEQLEAVQLLEEKVKDNEELCVEIAGSVAPALVRIVADAAKREPGLKLMLLTTDAGVGQKTTDVATSMIDAGAVPVLVKLIGSGDAKVQELSAAILGNLCHESTENQKIVAKEAPFKALVDLVSMSNIGPAQEAAYAIWNLTVGNEDNSGEIVRCGGVPKLVDLLKSSSDIAQENAAGALMHVTMSSQAKAAIKKADAIPRLCELLQPSYEPEVSSQAAGALLNLASDSAEYGRIIVKQGAIGPLINLVKDGADLAREYAAGALMNLIRGETSVAEQAAKEGAVPALASLLSKPTGHSEALGALANLASGSSERQIQIYKAQVTRKTVFLLNDPDVDVKRSAAALIMNLAPHQKIKERIVEAGALKPLASILRDEDDAVKERAAGALANLFNDHSGNVHAGFEQAKEMIPSLIAILEGKTLSDDAKRQSAHALAMLAAEDGPCDAVWNAGVCEPLLVLLKNMVAEAALAIMNLSWRWPEVKQQLAKGGTIQHLMRMLKTSDAMGKEYSAGALMNMTAASSENAMEAVPVVTFLVDLLKVDGIQAAEWAAGALANIVRAGSDAQKMAADAGAAASLAALLPKVTANGKTLVVLALTSLAEGSPATVASALSEKAKSKLRDFRDSGNKDLADYTQALVEKLGAGFSL